MNSLFNKTIKGKPRSGMSVVSNQIPAVRIIDVGPMCMKMNDTFHDAVKTSQQEEKSPKE